VATSWACNASTGRATPTCWCTCAGDRERGGTILALVPREVWDETPELDYDDDTVPLLSSDSMRKLRDMLDDLIGKAEVFERAHPIT
jgi:hypothetical protein